MSQTTAPTAGPHAHPERAVIGTHPSGDSLPRHDADATGHAGSIRHFLWHLAEMVAAMMIGMFVGYGAFLTIVGTSGDQARHDYPTAALLVMAVSMTIPMVAWMRFRRHTWRNSIEMGAAMLLPVVPFLGCLWADVFHDAPNGPYMAVSTVAMVGLMLYRWNVYSVHHPAKQGAPHVT